MPENRRPVAIHNAHPRLRFARSEIVAAIALLDKHAAQYLGGCPPGDLSIAFLTDSALARIHADFMNDSSPTDVITFEGNHATGQAGEICVSADTAARYVAIPSAKKSAPPKRMSAAASAKFSTELSLYIIHGWLHLAGYDDLQPAKKRRMRAAEKRAMAMLRTFRAMPVFRLG